MVWAAWRLITHPNQQGYMIRFLGHYMLDKGQGKHLQEWCCHRPPIQLALHIVIPLSPVGLGKVIPLIP
jgi:hypothetical protein